MSTIKAIPTKHDMLREACSIVEATRAAEDDAPVDVRPTGRNRQRFTLTPTQERT